VRHPSQQQFFEQCELACRKRPVELEIQAEPGKAQSVRQKQFRIEPGFFE
jgi:hypothetical protein